MEHEDLQRARNRLEKRFESLQRLESAEYAVYGILAAVFGFMVSMVVLSTGPETGTDTEQRASFNVSLTDYQKKYVDCPHQHIYICTRMSKLGTEQVSYKDARDGRIYLRYSGSDRLVARMPQNGTEGYLISIDRNYYNTENTQDGGEPPQNSEDTGNKSVQDTDDTEVEDANNTQTVSAGDTTPTNTTQETDSTNTNLTARNQTNSTQTS